MSKVTKFSHFYDLSKKKHVALLFVVVCIDPSPLLTAALVMKLYVIKEEEKRKSLDIKNPSRKDVKVLSIPEPRL